MDANRKRSQICRWHDSLLKKITTLPENPKEQ